MTLGHYCSFPIATKTTDRNNTGDELLLPLFPSDFPALIDLLVASGARVNASTLSGQTPLRVAIRDWRLAAVEALIRGGASIKAATECQERQEDFEDSLIRKKDAIAEILANEDRNNNSVNDNNNNSFVGVNRNNSGINNNSVFELNQIVDQALARKVSSIF